MNKRPDSDLCPIYSGDYSKDMAKWREQTGCNYPECGCHPFLMKGTCQHEETAIVDKKKANTDVNF